MPPRKKEQDEQEQTEQGGDLVPVKKRQGSAIVWNAKAQEFGITDKQLKFCDLYANDNELRGNGVQCYAEAYKLDLNKPGVYNTAKMRAARLLTQSNVLHYINHIFESTGLNDTSVDQELLFAIRQNADFGSKVAAIKVYNDLKGRIQKQQSNSINFQINIAPSTNATEGEIIEVKTKE